MTHELRSLLNAYVRLLVCYISLIFAPIGYMVSIFHPQLPARRILGSDLLSRFSHLFETRITQNEALEEQKQVGKRM